MVGCNFNEVFDTQMATFWFVLGCFIVCLFIFGWGDEDRYGKS